MKPTACGTANCDAAGSDGARRTSAILRETYLVRLAHSDVRSDAEPCPILEQQPTSGGAMGSMGR